MAKNKTRKCAQAKRIAKPEKKIDKNREKQLQNKNQDDININRVEQISTSMFFKYNSQLGPPYQVIIDTNFINFAIKNKIDIVQGMLECLYAECIPYITDCVMAELEKLGPKYRVALTIAKDPRIRRLCCMHKGTYADDCIVQRVQQHRAYIVATCDKDLRRRIRKIPGVPIMFVQAHKFSIERLPEATMGGAPRV